MHAKKSLGQHFLRCRWVVSTLVKAAELGPNDTVLEIGPGTGVLTRALAGKVRQVIAVEKDEVLAELLRAKKPTQTKIITGDILKILTGNRLPVTDKYKVVANIPYYLTSRLLRLLLEGQNQPELIVLTIQKEVAQRIIARPPKMNLLALSVQAFGTPEIIKTVPAQCFRPEPKVDSAIIKIADISDGFFQKNGIDKKLFFEIARRAFSQKRKMLSTSLRPLFVQHPVLNIGKARPQELDPRQWAEITRELSTAAKKLN